jgi:hypothetical protein
MEREPNGGPNGGMDVGRDHARDLGDEPPPLYRDAPPDVLAPIDESAPVSGHIPAFATSAASVTESPEHDWTAAAPLIYPSFRPVGTQGLRVEDVDARALAEDQGRTHSQPLVDEGPAGLPVVYALHAGSFDVIVNADHLLSWGVQPSDIQDAALRNLAAWAASAPWSDEASGERRIMSSDTGDGWDAVRILLPECREQLARELGATGRILVGLPERHLLLAGSLRPDDHEFAEMFAEFVLEQSGGADEPIDRRVFELVGGRLVEFVPTPV